jgi:tetratricopeptide (TPR) repeat protein
VPAVADTFTDQDSVWQAREVVRLLVKSVKLRRLYARDHAYAVSALAELRGSLSSFITRFEKLRLDVSRDKLLVGEAEAYSEPSREANLASALYQGGVRQLTFSGGDEGDLEKIVAIFSSKLEETDLAARLWESELATVEYVCLDELMEGWDVPDDLSAEARAKIANMNSHASEIIELARKRRAKTQGTVEHEATDTGEEFRSLDKIKLSGAKAAGLDVTDEDLRALKHEVETNTLEDVFLSLVTIVIDGRVLAPQALREDNAAWFLDEAASLAMRTGNLTLLAALLDRYVQELRAAPKELAATLSRVVAHLSSPESQEQLVKVACGASIGGPAAFCRILAALGDAGITAGVTAYLAAGSKELRDSLNAFLAANAERKPDELLRLIQPDVDAETVRWALFLASKSLKGPVAKNLYETARLHASEAVREYANFLWRTQTPEGRIAAFLAALEAPDEAERVRAAETLGRAKDMEALPALVRLVEDEAFERRSSPEQRAFMGALSELGGDAAERAIAVHAARRRKKQVRAVGVTLAVLLLGAGVAVLGKQRIEKTRLATGRSLLVAARDRVKAGAQGAEVASILSRALALAGSDEANLLEAGRLLLAAGDPGARTPLELAVERFDSCEALFELGRTEPRVIQGLEWAGASRRTLAARPDARARAGLLAIAAESRVLADAKDTPVERLRSQAMLLAGDTPDVRTARAILSLEMGDDGDAVAEATRAIDAWASERPDDARAAEALFIRAKALLAQGDLASALRDVNAVLAHEPAHARALALRSQALARKGSAAKGRLDLEASLAAYREEDPVLLAERADAAAAQGDLDRALAWLGRACALEPRNGTRLVARASLLVRKGALDEARKCLDEAEAKGVAREDLLHLARGELALASGNAAAGDEARTELERALALDPTLIPALLRQGELATRRSQYDDAVALFDRVIAIAPRFTQARLLRVRALELHGDRAAALDGLDGAIKADPLDPVPVIQRAELRLELATPADFKLAIEDFDRALALEAAWQHPLRASWIVARGNAHLKKQVYSAALVDFERALELDAEDAATFALEAQAQVGLKMLDKAIEAMEKAVELERKHKGSQLAGYEARLEGLRRDQQLQGGGR